MVEPLWIETAYFANNWIYMSLGSEYVIFVDIEPSIYSYEEMSVDFVTKKLETGTIHVV